MGAAPVHAYLHPVVALRAGVGVFTFGFLVGFRSTDF